MVYSLIQSKDLVCVEWEQVLIFQAGPKYGFQRAIACSYFSRFLVQVFDTLFFIENKGFLKADLTLKI
jgi:hypothetical protein